jgi:hypothetical protein
VMYGCAPSDSMGCKAGCTNVRVPSLSAFNGHQGCEEGRQRGLARPKYDVTGIRPGRGARGCFAGKAQFLRQRQTRTGRALARDATDKCGAENKKRLTA